MKDVSHTYRYRGDQSHPTWEFAVAWALATLLAWTTPATAQMAVDSGASDSASSGSGSAGSGAVGRPPFPAVPPIIQKPHRLSDTGMSSGTGGSALPSPSAAKPQSGEGATVSTGAGAIIVAPGQVGAGGPVDSPRVMPGVMETTR